MNVQKFGNSAASNINSIFLKNISVKFLQSGSKLCRFTDFYTSSFYRLRYLEELSVADNKIQVVSFVVICLFVCLQVVLRKFLAPLVL